MIFRGNITCTLNRPFNYQIQVIEADNFSLVQVIVILWILRIPALTTRFPVPQSHSPPFHHIPTTSPPTMTTTCSRGTSRSDSISFMIALITDRGLWWMKSSDMFTSIRGKGEAMSLCYHLLSSEPTTTTIRTSKWPTRENRVIGWTGIKILWSVMINRQIKALKVPENGRDSFLLNSDGLREWGVSWTLR